MRNDVGLITLALCLSFPCDASAEKLDWQGTLEVDLGDLGPLRFRGGGVATVNGSGAQLTRLRVAGGIAGEVTIPITDPDLTATLRAIRISPELGTGTLSPFWPVEPWPDPQLIENALPIGGALRLCTFDPSCQTAQIIPLTGHGGQTGIGAGGLLTVGGFGSFRVSVAANPWTVFTAELVVDTSDGGTAILPTTGWIHGPSSFSSSVAQAGGELQLVTPVEIRGDTGLYLPGFSRLTIAFVPEPGALLLLGSGIVSLAAVSGDRRSRRPERSRWSRRGSPPAA